MRILYALAFLAMIASCKKEDPAPKTNTDKTFTVPCDSWTHLIFDMDSVRINTSIVKSEHHTYIDYIVFNTDSSCAVTVHMTPDYTSSCPNQYIMVLQEGENGWTPYQTSFVKGKQSIMNITLKGKAGAKFYCMIQGHGYGWPPPLAWYEVN